MTEPITLLSFFAGVGGIDLGFHQAGNFKTIYANEFDKFARTTFEANFNLKVDHRDIRNISEEEIPYGDILLAGFPCQPFSVAGYRKGFEDDRGGLFFDTLRIIKKVQPKVVFLENVKNMVTHDNGNTFKVIREGLEMNGYYLKWAVLNAKEYGNIPQNRERIYIVGFRSKDAFEKFDFPGKIPLLNPLDKYIDFNNKVENIFYYSKTKNPTFYDKLEKAITRQDTVYQWRRQYVRENKSGVVPTLTANMGTGGHNVPLILAKHGIRKLTPRETFNIQGFPKNFILPREISNGQLYKQAGNSVVVSVIKRIATNILEALDSAEEKSMQIKNRRFTVLYTKMTGSNKGESFLIKEFDTMREVNEFALKKGIRIIDNDLYKRIIRRKKESEFFMVKDLEESDRPILLTN